MTDRTWTNEKQTKLVELQRQAGELAKQALAVAEQAKELIGPTDKEMEDAWASVGEQRQDMGWHSVSAGVVDDLWDMLDDVLAQRGDDQVDEVREEEGQWRR